MSKPYIHAQIKELLQSLDDEFYKNTFGDHVAVTVTAKGATTEEYQHD